MGKTEKGAIWLNKDLFSPYEYWQFWRNTDDRDVKRFLNYFTDIKTEEIENICDKEKNINKLKILLANNATRILHGKKASLKAEQSAKATFEAGGVGTDLPEIKIKHSDIISGINLLDLLSSSNITSSKSEARRTIANKGLKINNVVISDDKKILQPKDFRDKSLKISIGKKKHFLIKVT